MIGTWRLLLSVAGDGQQLDGLTQVAVAAERARGASLSGGVFV